MSTTKTAKFAWTPELSSTAVSAYAAMLADESKGVEYANSDGLKEIQELTGAPSIVSVRSKLTSAKAYQKADAPRKVGGVSSLRKAHYVRVFAKHAVEAELIDSADELASMEQMKLEHLETLAKMCGFYDEVKESV